MPELKSYGGNWLVDNSHFLFIAVDWKVIYDGETASRNDGLQPLWLIDTVYRYGGIRVRARGRVLDGK